MHFEHPDTPPTLRTASLLATGLLVVGVLRGADAGADETAASAASVTLEGGGLSISAPVDAGNLGTESNGLGAVTISGQLGQVQVADSRGAPAGSGWTATAISTAFAQTGGPSIGAASVSYTAGVITKTGTATYTANDPGDLATVSAVVTATDVTGNNTASWNPTIHVTVSGGMPAGTYLGTITHSVS